MPDTLRSRLRKRLKPSSRTYLVPRKRGAGESRYDREWGVVVNIDPGLLFKI